MLLVCLSVHTECPRQRFPADRRRPWRTWAAERGDAAHSRSVTRRSRWPTPAGDLINPQNHVMTFISFVTNGYEDCQKTSVDVYYFGF